MVGTRCTRVCPGGRQERRRSGRPSSTKWRRSLRTTQQALSVAGQRPELGLAGLQKPLVRQVSTWQSRNAVLAQRGHAFASTFSCFMSCLCWPGRHTRCRCSYEPGAMRAMTNLLGTPPANHRSAASLGCTAYGSRSNRPGGPSLARAAASSAQVMACLAGGKHKGRCSEGTPADSVANRVPSGARECG